MRGARLNAGPNHPEFRDDFGVFVCDHVFAATAPVLLSVRDWDGSWQFLREDLRAGDEVHLVHVGALLRRDPSLAILASLECGTYAERVSADTDWQCGELESESAGGDGA